MDSIIQIESLSKEYRDGEHTLTVLGELNVAVAPGEFVSIVGPSGSGKTTLLNIIGGLDQDFRGRALVEGRELRSLGDRELAIFRNRSIGFVFQSFNLLDHLTCLENILLPSYFASNGKRHAPRARELLGRVGLADKEKQRPSTLSGGQRQRLAIARAMLMEPRILLCDEPTGNLDAATGTQILEIFLELHGEGITLIMVTHEDLVSRLAGRVLHLEAGRIVAEERP